jgi:hypothetical protein
MCLRTGNTDTKNHGTDPASGTHHADTDSIIMADRGEKMTGVDAYGNGRLSCVRDDVDVGERDENWEHGVLIRVLDAVGNVHVDGGDLQEDGLHLHVDGGETGMVVERDACEEGLAELQGRDVHDDARSDDWTAVAVSVAEWIKSADGLLLVRYEECSVSMIRVYFVCVCVISVLCVMCIFCVCVYDMFGQMWRMKAMIGLRLWCLLRSRSSLRMDCCWCVTRGVLFL